MNQIIQDYGLAGGVTQSDPSRQLLALWRRSLSFVCPLPCIAIRFCAASILHRLALLGRRLLIVVQATERHPRGKRTPDRRRTDSRRRSEA